VKKDPERKISRRYEKKRVEPTLFRILNSRLTPKRILVTLPGAVKKSAIRKKSPTDKSVLCLTGL
jgi:hypothetical protein